MAGMLDLEQELKVAEQFWNFLANKDIYAELLDVFAQVGTNLRREIDAYFHKYNFA